MAQWRQFHSANYSSGIAVHLWVLRLLASIEDNEERGTRTEATDGLMFLVVSAVSFLFCFFLNFEKCDFIESVG